VVYLQIWDCGWWTKGLQPNSGKVEQYVTEMAIGPEVTKSVMDKWIEGKNESATVKIVIHDAGLDNGLSHFGTEQLACNPTHYKEEFDIHVEDQAYTILSLLKGGGGKKVEANTYIMRKGKIMTSYTHFEKGDKIEWKIWRENDFGVNFDKRPQPRRSLYNWWDWDFEKNSSIHLWSIARINYLFNSTLLSPTQACRKKVETKLVLRQ
jgi:hypothetical protein